MADWMWTLQGFSLGLLFLSFCIAVASFFAARASATRDAMAVATARERAAKAEAGVEKLKLEVASANERWAVAERQLLELKQRMAGRTLDAVQQLAIKQTLSIQPSSIKVVLLGDAEAKGFAQDIIRAIRSAGWTVSTLEIGVVSPPEYGLTFSTGLPQGAQLPPDSVRLLQALQAAKLPYTVNAGGTFRGPDRASGPGLLVGLKPPQ